MPEEPAPGDRRDAAGRLTQEPRLPAVGATTGIVAVTGGAAAVAGASAAGVVAYSGAALTVASIVAAALAFMASKSRAPNHPPSAVEVGQRHGMQFWVQRFNARALSEAHEQGTYMFHPEEVDGWVRQLTVYSERAASYGDEALQVGFESLKAILEVLSQFDVPSNDERLQIRKELATLSGAIQKAAEARNPERLRIDSGE